MFFESDKCKKSVDEGMNSSILSSVSEIVSAYIARHDTTFDEITDLIFHVYRTMSHLGRGEMDGLAAPLEPCVPINQSVMADYIVCLEDGKKLKMLKRHLRAAYNMTPEQYRERWNLPEDYPMVAPNYAKKRSELAKINGLGQGYAQPKDGSKTAQVSNF